MIYAITNNCYQHYAVFISAQIPKGLAYVRTESGQNADLQSANGRRFGR
jgi:hypothetical protein